MARDEHDREDLLAEAKALVVRAELRLPGEAHSLLFGFRRDGCVSVYFSADVAYHFNAACELRRAHLDGLMYKAEQGKLVSLRRVRTAHEVLLHADELSPAKTASFLAEICRRLEAVGSLVSSGGYELKGQVPADGDAASRFVEWLSQLPRPLSIALSPHAR